METTNELQKENQRLRNTIQVLKASLEEKDENCYSLAVENKKLKIQVATAEGEIKGLKTAVNKLHEDITRYEKEEDRLNTKINGLVKCNIKLQERVDNKQKVYDNLLKDYK